VLFFVLLVLERLYDTIATIEYQIRRAIDSLASRFPKITEEEEKAILMNEFRSKLPLDEWSYHILELSETTDRFHSVVEVSEF
jgi:hypothetical protein